VSKIVMVGSSKTKDAHTLEFSGGTVDEIAGKVALFMGQRGYRLESGDRLQGVYGRGSAAWAAMMGPLVSRAKFNVTVAQKGDRVTVVVARGMTGWGGGALTARRVGKEFQEVVAGLQEAILT